MNDWRVPSCAPDWPEVDSSLEPAISEALAAVLRWEWQPADSTWEDPRPYSDERIGKSPVKARQKGWSPRDRTNGVRYGWDAQDRLRVAERFTTWGDEVILHSQEILTFAFSEGGDHLSVHRDRRPDGSSPTELRVITRRIVEDGRLTGLVTTWSPELDRSPLWIREDFEFDESGLICGTTAHRDRGEHHPDVRFGEPQRSVIRFEATHDELGALMRLDRQEFSESGDVHSDRKVVWQRTSADELRAAEEVIDRLLPDAVRRWVARVAPAAPAYCVAILYGDSWSPSIGIGTSDDLEGWGPLGSEARTTRMWNPAEFLCFDPAPAELNASKLSAAYRVTAQQWGADAPDKIRAQCLTVAAELKTAQFVGLKPAPEFLVYAIDTELMDLDANLRKLGLGRLRKAIER